MTYLQPLLPLLIIAIVIGIRLRKRAIVAAAATALFLCGWEPVAALLSGSLEWWYPIRHFPSGDADAIVVLGGGVIKHDASEPQDLPTSDTYVRVSYASWLYHNWRPLPIVVSGGPTSGRSKPVVLAAVMRQLLIEQGVPAPMIWLEDRSRSTYENAMYSAQLLRSRGLHRVALVTEAHHMLRSEKSFLRQGMVVVPAPCAYRWIQFTAEPEQFLPNPKALEINELVLHEWVGLLWYRASGKL